MKARKLALARGTLAAVVWVSGSGVALANMDLLKKAKAAGYPATGCTYCHVDKLPKKDAHPWNDRGTYLVEHKARQKANQVDVTWLKDYKEPAAKK